NAQGGMQPPGGPLPPGGPMPPNAPQEDPSAKAAWWEAPEPVKSASYIGRPVPLNVAQDPSEPTETQIKANALAAMLRSLANDAG
ncbi:MAG: hypothetical protein EBT15_09670, partial [Betaproteobacteria bacterium]|nr:hypothetical protein [Betaproteobacteria bacterium]